MTTVIKGKFGLGVQNEAGQRLTDFCQENVLVIANKASGGDGIPAELFQILKDDAVKVLYSMYQQIWKTQQWPQDWKRSIIIPSQKQCQRMLKLPYNCTHLTC